MPAKTKTVVVMPAYNAAATLERTFRDIPPGVADEIILVDDASSDETVELSRRLGLTTIAHESNRGYGANQKTCYDAALEAGADFVVMLHPDYQYDSRLVPHLVGFLKSDVCDVVLGNRIRTRREALANGMPPYKYLANRALTIIQNVLTGQNLSEWHTGYRAYKRAVLETVPYRRNTDDFAFDSEFLAQCVYFNFRIGDVPVPVRYFAEASSIGLRRSLTYGAHTLLTHAALLLARAGLPSPLFQSPSPRSTSPPTPTV